MDEKRHNISSFLIPCFFFTYDVRGICFLDSFYLEGFFINHDPFFPRHHQWTSFFCCTCYTSPLYPNENSMLKFLPCLVSCQILVMITFYFCGGLSIPGAGHMIG